MAHVTTDVQHTIDEWLDYLVDAWRELPRAVVDIAHWELTDQIDYVEEWTPKEETAVQLRRLIGSPDATNQQRARYSQLEQLMHDNRPLLDRLRAS